MNWRERTLLALTIVGFIVPNAMLGFFAARRGLTFSGYFRPWVGTLPAAQLTLDLGVTFVTFALWAAWEGRRLEMRSWWLPAPASLLLGLCFATPLFLLLRERAIQAEDTRGRASNQLLVVRRRPARAMTTPSIAPSQAIATSFAGGPGGIDPSFRPASISWAQYLSQSLEHPVDRAPDRSPCR